MSNERNLISRNKREGYYAGHGMFDSAPRHFRTGKPNKWCVTRSLRDRASEDRGFARVASAFARLGALLERGCL